VPINRRTYEIGNGGGFNNLSPRLEMMAGLQPISTIDKVRYDQLAVISVI
jgi:hypothetical protein